MDFRIKKQNQENLMTVIQIESMKKLWVILRFLPWGTRSMLELLSRIKNIIQRPGFGGKTISSVEDVLEL